MRNTFEQGKFRGSRLDPSFTARTGLFLFRTYWVDIIPILGEILKTLRETRISYVILAISVYLLSVLICSPLAVGLFCIGYDLKATSLVPIYYGALLINNITPADTTGGEPIRILLANKRFGISYADAFKTKTMHQ